MVSLHVSWEVAVGCREGRGTGAEESGKGGAGAARGLLSWPFAVQMAAPVSKVETGWTRPRGELDSESFSACDKPECLGQ